MSHAADRATRTGSGGERPRSISPPEIEPMPVSTHPLLCHETRQGALLARLLRTTDHKLIGQMYMVTSFVFFALGGVMALRFGGLTGVMLAIPAFDFHVGDTYFLVAHFHYVLFGTIVFAAYSGIYFWFPKFTGRYVDERRGRLHFWLTFIGFHLTFLVQHWLGSKGMPRRNADYLPTGGFATLITISTIGSFVLGLSMLPFIWNVWRSYRYGEICTADDAWGHGNSLEWATSSPPPRHNFTSIPRIRSERTAFEAHDPHLLDRLEAEARSGRSHRPAERLAATSIGSGRQGENDQVPRSGGEENR